MPHAPYIGSLQNTSRLAGHLRLHGFAEGPAEEKAAMLARCAEALQATDASDVERRRAYWVPGRIEVLGKHTDYAGGSSLVAAAERGFCLVAAETNENEVVVTDVASDESISFCISPDLEVPLGHWSNYPITVARRMARNFAGRWQGGRLALVSDLPAAAGMSSSSALMIAVFHALADVNDIWHHTAFPQQLNDPMELAGYLATIENGQSYGDLSGDRGVGTFGGSEDHTAILCARSGAIRQFAYCPVRFERDLAMPRDHVFAIAASGVVAEKTGGAREKYNRASRLAAAVAEVWRRGTGRSDPHLAAILRADESAEQRLQDLLADAKHDEFRDAELQRRLAHFTSENQRIIPMAGSALQNGDLPAFGRAVSMSQSGAERLLGNQVRETSYLADVAAQIGAVAASAFGAGFGGSVWAMVHRDRAGAITDLWRDRYLRDFPQHADRCRFFITSAGPPMLRIV